MMNLIIKGDLHAAVTAAEARRIPLVSVMQRVGLGCSRDETVASVREDFFERVVRWYAEDARIVTGFGYPAGTLLHYSNH